VTVAGPKETKTGSTALIPSSEAKSTKIERALRCANVEFVR